jgi:hypothetical protein
MPIYLVLNDATGEIVSQGSSIADPLPEGLVALIVDPAPDWSAVQWDAPLRTLVPRPAATRPWCSQVEFTKRIGMATMTAVNMIRMDPATPLQLRAQLETLRQVMQDATRIELDDGDTIAGVQLVAALAASAGIIANTPEAIATEAARILAPFPA